ncbi:MAG: glycoside hydrolase family 172 protein [Bacteroidota bacterium]|nr:glycoside hydrolase family 172 protein [Bacteroidota bacterium]
MNRINLFSVIAVLFLFAACDNKLITLDTLLEEMVDKSAVSYFPEQEYSLKQFSSYDRKSVSPEDENWWANADWTQFVREEKNDGRREFVLFDANGPGAVVRYWMTFSGDGAAEGTLRIYIDKNKTPVIEGDVLNILSGDFLAPEPLATSVSPEAEYKVRGHNLYLPIPYSKHCKITYECDAVRFEDDQWKPSIYYNINYRIYKSGVRVKSFTKDYLINSKPLIEKTSATLLKPDITGVQDFSKTKTLASSDEILMDISENGKAISKIKIKIDAQDLNQALRSTVLRISFDGEETVWVPIGEFFGTGYQIHSSKTWYTKVNENGQMEATWLMPFKKSSNISVVNYGTQKVEVALDVSTSEYKWNSLSMYFGVSWHELNGINTASNLNLDNDEWHYDLNYVDLKGEGVYVGDALTIFNTVNIWWGEGDEKIFVDGEDFPSCIGTGTEDYYGYAWCRPEKFTHPFIAQPTGAGNFTPGMTVNLRYRSLDAMPFKKELSSNIEMWHWVKTKMNYAMTAFWYVKPGFKSNVSPNIELVKMPVALKRSDVVKPFVDKDGKIEGESLEVVTCDSGTFSIQYGSGLSGKTQLWWRNAAIGDQLIARFILNETGKFKITAQLTKAPDYGIIQVSLNGKTIVKSINCFNESDVEVFPIDFGDYVLNEGENIFSLKIMGADKSAKPGNMAGIDYLKFEKIK